MVWDLGLLPPLQNSVISEDKEISKELAEASKNNFIAQKNMTETPTVGKKIPPDDILDNWDILDAFCERTVNGDQYPQKAGLITKKKNLYEKKYYQQISDCIKKNFLNKENIGKCFSVYRLGGMSYAYGGCNFFDKIGGLYIEEDGTMTLYSTKDVFDLSEINDRCSYGGSSFSIPRFKGDFYGNIPPEDIVAFGLLKDGRGEEAISILDKPKSPCEPRSPFSKENKEYKTALDDAEKRQVGYLLSLGREDEALERFPQKADYINNTVNLIKLSCSEYEHLEEPLTLNDYLAKGDLKGAVLHHRSSELPEPLSKQSSNTLLEIADYIEDNNLFEKWEQMNREKSINSATGVIDKKFEPSQRVLLDIFTLGVPEVINQVTKQYEKLQVNKSIDVDVNKKRELICLALLYMLKAKEEIVPTTKDFAKTTLDIAASKEPAKNLLHERLLKPIADYQHNENVKVPGCVMLTGNNPYIAKDLMNWIEENYSENINCVKLSSKKDSAQMYENILEALETAEENYQETNKRSVIFVNGMEKLLRNDINASDDIAKMKNFMDKAGRYFHSTIIFYAKEPNKLDPGTVGSHKIGLKINLPDCGKAELLEWRNV